VVLQALEIERSNKSDRRRTQPANPNPPPINLLGRVVLGANPTLVHIIGPLLMLPPAGVIKQ